MNTDDIKQVCNQIVTIMIKYPHLFPIVEIIQRDEKCEGFFGHILEYYCGLRMIVAVKMDAMMKLWPTTDLKDLKNLKNTLVKSILLEYVKLIFLSDEAMWDDMIKAENL